MDGTKLKVKVMPDEGSVDGGAKEFDNEFISADGPFWGDFSKLTHSLLSHQTGAVAAGPPQREPSRITGRRLPDWRGWRFGT